MSDSEEDEKAEKQYKIIIIGDPETGKSSLVSKYTKDKFSKQYKPTTGVEFYLKRTIVTGGKYITLKENQLSTFAVSSKTGEGVNLCFQKISAELLGIKLSKAEQEQHQPVFKAEIVSYPDDKLPAPPQSNFKTTVCCIQ
ncbi:ras-related protein Rab-28-like [Lepeophtheirus salmonis]|uniref:ras-related protein Rab-28-like n=1 Tax=Lepeophtheirus salmonis TaxID=72036 RepID=UPI003AF344D2